MKKNKQRASLFSRGDSVAMFFVFASILVIAVLGSYKSLYPSTSPAGSAMPCPSPEISTEDLPYYQLVVAASEQYGIEISRIYATMKAESDFDPKAVSRAGARGLMQMMPSTYKDICKDIGIEYDPDDLFDPIVNIDVCTFYLKKQYERLGDWDLAHAAYNAGYTRVKSWLGDPRYSQDGKLVNIPIRETATYVKNINRYYSEYKAALED